MKPILDSMWQSMLLDIMFRLGVSNLIARMEQIASVGWSSTNFWTQLPGRSWKFNQFLKEIWIFAISLELEIRRCLQQALATPNWTQMGQSYTNQAHTKSMGLGPGPASSEEGVWGWRRPGSGPRPTPMDFVYVLVCISVFLCTRSIYQVSSD